MENLRVQGEHEFHDVLSSLAAIARDLQPSRCQHSKETGFKGFADEVRRELGPITAKP